MRVKINQKWKTEIVEEISKLEKIVENLFDEHLKDICNPKIEGKLEYYKRELSFLRGRLSAIEVIEAGCFYEIVSDEEVKPLEIFNEVEAYV